MPKICRGDVYQLGSRLYYRCPEMCVVGGKEPVDITPLTKLNKCPQCRKPCKPTFHKKDPMTRTTIEVRLPLTKKGDEFVWVRHSTYEEER